MAHVIQPRRVRVGGFRFSSGGSRSVGRSSVLQLHDFAILVLVQKLTIKMDGNGVHLD